jgi:hypothetical protein
LPRKRPASSIAPPQSGRTVAEFLRYPGTIVKAAISRFVMRKSLKSAGFMPPANRTLGSGHRTAVAQLIASMALAVSTAVAATVVSIGIAKADVVSNVIDNEGSLFAIALVLGLLFIGMGGLTILSMPDHKHKNTHS